MRPDRETLELLRRQLEELRADWYAAGRGDEFEDHVRRLKADGNLPFDD